ncbi:MAG: extracellular solute-binding protein [Candidatus Pacebacteria bacterium]|jgi:ABC-type glycerol-3-phosphate transport system substrate-binding protein|nr:extracellular solute-binding protein [Candidatus Paceibacterota bacterium]
MNLRPFELFLVLGFGLLGLLALGLLATYKPPVDTATTALGGAVEIWGTLPEDAFYQTLKPIVEVQPAYAVISYREINPNTFDNDLLNALAEDRGPDLVLLPHEELVAYRSKIQPIPFENFPERDFRNLYVDGAEIWKLTDGIYGYPIAVDPLVMYWNRDILSSKNMLSAPTSWEAIVNDIVPTYVQRDFNRNITLSPLAFGEYRNVQNAQEIISMLTIQGGSSLVVDAGEGKYSVLLNQSADRGRTPLEAAVTFYTNFASPSNPLYSWNRARPLDRDAFLSEDLILYFGKGSEARGIAAQNPNLNFDIAEVPQGATASVRRTYGTFYGLSLLRSANNKQGAFLAMQLVGGVDFAREFSGYLDMAPAHRASLASGSSDTYGRIIYSSTIVARGWLAPAPARVDTIFTQMVEDVLANRRRPTDSAGDAVGRLSQEY